MTVLLHPICLPTQQEDLKSFFDEVSLIEIGLQPLITPTENAKKAIVIIW